MGNFPPPLQATGRVLSNILANGDRYSTGQILGINDVHGNITGIGLTQTDPFTGARSRRAGLRCWPPTSSRRGPLTRRTR
jgi:hypothetical protein